MSRSSNTSVSAVIVTRGAGGYIRPCLDSLAAQTSPPVETFVIDNSADPSLAAEISARYPHVSLTSNPENLFYCQALNNGIEQSKEEFVLCLNDDVILDRYFIEKALEGFSFDPAVGMVSGKILRQDGVTVDSAGLSLTLWRTAKERGYGRKDRGRFGKKGYIFGVNGAVAFYRRKMLDEIKEKGGYFDPDFRIFYEDLDIAWRAQRRGWKGYYCPAAIAHHVRGGTVRSAGGINRPHARRYLDDALHADLIKNRYLAVIKNESAIGFLCHFPFIAAYDAAQWGYILLFRPRQVKNFIFNMKYLWSALTGRK